MSNTFLDQELRLADEAIIQFETSSLVRAGFSPDNFKIIHKDILLLLPDFFDWCKVSDFINTFPESQEQILCTIKELYNAGILIPKVQYNEDILTSSECLPQSVSESESIFFNLHNHHLMVKDYVRAAAYWHAIEANVTSEDVTLELGCGSGILTFFAARAGAKKQFAIEINKDLVEMVTRPMAVANGYADKLTFLLGNSMTIPTSAVNPKATVFIAEILGDGIFNENIISYTIDARDRFLAPGAKLLPKGLDVYIFAYENPFKQAEFSSSYLKKIADAKSSRTDSMYLKYDTYNNKMLTYEKKAVYIDLTTIKDSNFNVSGELEVFMPGNLNGFCLYFVAHIDDNNLLSNSPWSPQISWTQQLFNVTPSKAVNIGDKVKYSLIYDGFLKLSLED